MSVQEFTSEELQSLEDFAEMRESDPEGIAVLVGDLGDDVTDVDTDGSHANMILEID